MENLEDEVFTKEETENIEQIVEENLTAEEILNPEGWILIGFLIAWAFWKSKAVKEHH